MRDVVVDGSALTVDDVVAVARGQARVKLADDVPKRMEARRCVVVEALRGGAPVYGVNTGFGALADTPVGEADLTTLQGAIVRSHAAAIGAPLDDETVRPPGRRGAARARARAADACPQGRSFAGQRHRTHAGPAGLLGARRQIGR